MEEPIGLGDSIWTALAMAGEQRDGPISTSLLLRCLISSDTGSPWHYVTLSIGEPHQLAGRWYPDPDSKGSWTWKGIPLTDTVHEAFDYCWELADAHGYPIVTSGLLAIALLANPRSGAARTVHAVSEVNHRQAIELVHEHLFIAKLPQSELFPPWDRQPKGTTFGRRTATGTEREAQISRPTTALDLVQELCTGADNDADDPNTVAELSRDVLVDDPDVYDQVRPLVAGLDDESADAVTQRARDLFDTDDPTDLDLIAAATLEPSPAVEKFFWYIALDHKEFGSAARDLSLTGQGKRADVSNSVTAYTLVSLFITLAVSALVVTEVAESRTWWHLAVLWLVWSGHPQLPALLPAAYTVPVFLVAGPIAAAIQFIGALLEIPWARSERRSWWARTGLRLTLAQRRRVLQRRHAMSRPAVLFRQRWIGQRRIGADQ